MFPTYESNPVLHQFAYNLPYLTLGGAAILSIYRERRVEGALFPIAFFVSYLLLARVDTDFLQDLNLVVHSQLMGLILPIMAVSLQGLLRATSPASLLRRAGAPLLLLLPPLLIYFGYQIRFLPLAWCYTVLVLRLPLLSWLLIPATLAIARSPRTRPSAWVPALALLAPLLAMGNVASTSLKTSVAYLIFALGYSLSGLIFVLPAALLGRK